MKKYGIIAVALAVLLCGCSGNDASSQSSSSASSEQSAVSSAESSTTSAESTSYSTSSTASSQSTVSSAESSTPQSDGSTFLTGLAGDRILSREITTVFTTDGNDCPPEELTEDNFTAVLCSGFTYVAEQSGMSRNSIDNADVYDSGTMAFTDMTAVPTKDFVRVDVGGTICGMTLTQAEVNFARGSDTEVFTLSDGSTKTGAELGLPEIYFAGSTAKFEGEFEMDGYICKGVENTYNIGEGDIMFVPCDGEANFPVMSYRLSGDDGFYHTSQVYSLNGLTWQNEFGYIALGNVNTTDADVSGLPDDGSFVKAHVTADGLTLNCGLNFVSTVSADLAEISY